MPQTTPHDLTLTDVQREVDEWVQGYAGGYWEPLAILARLVEEVGELARLLNHVHGPKRKKATEAAQDMGEEMADVLYTLVCMANVEGVALDDAFAGVMDKLRTRDAGRFRNDVDENQAGL